MAYSFQRSNDFADYLAKLGRQSFGQQVIRCYWCGHRKPRQGMMCENCLRYPPK